MKIGLNATCFSNRPSGARQRFVGIYGELVKRMPETEFVVYEPLDCSVTSWLGDTPNVSCRHTPLPSFGRIQKFVGGIGYWSKALGRENFDLFECFNLPLFKARSGRTVLTIHDIRRTIPEWGFLERSMYKLALSKALVAADHVITGSESAKAEILSFFPSVDISVIYNGLDVSNYETLTETDLSTTREIYNLPQKFILAVGHLEQRKNYLCLIDAVAKIRDQGNACRLVIVGNDSGERKAIEEKIQSCKLTAEVQLFSGLSDIEVRCFYRLCDLFVFPSTYEGFGIPIIEAMAAGCPMVLSDIPVFREITENLGIYFRYDDADNFAWAISKVLSSSSERTRQIEYGHERVKAFSFKSLAAQLQNLYSTLLK